LQRRNVWGIGTTASWNTQTVNMFLPVTAIATAIVTAIVTVTITVVVYSVAAVAAVTVMLTLSSSTHLIQTHTHSAGNTFSR